MRLSQRNSPENRRDQQGWALPPPRRQSDTDQPDQPSIKRAHARSASARPCDDQRECESSAGGGVVCKAQQCLRGLAEEAPPAEGQQALRGVHDEPFMVENK